MSIPISKKALAVTIVTCLFGAATSALAQTEASAAASETAASSAKPLTKTEQRKQLRAQRKAARKEAHAKNAAELKKLESAGYRPGANDLDYPENAQKAEQKAAAGTAASQ